MGITAQELGAKRVAAFVAQIGHESGQLNYVRAIWGPTSAQIKCEGRADLGNTVAGDGSRYRGLLPGKSISVSLAS